MKTLILTPNKTEMCGMYQLAKDLAKEFDGDILTRDDNWSWKLDKTNYAINTQGYDQVITLFYPMHKYGKLAQKNRAKWICYDQAIPPVNKMMFPNFFRRQYMKLFKILNESSMAGADEYWDISRPQKPRWTEKKLDLNGMKIAEKCAIYLGRTDDYKNYEWLSETMQELHIHLIHPQKVSDEEVHFYLSNAKMLVTASLWEGFGRGVAESEALGIPAVCYDVGQHKKHVKKGICVPCYNKEMFKDAVSEVWRRECQQ